MILFALLLFFPLLAFGQSVEPFIVSEPKAVATMIELAKLTPRDTLYDLGSGDGRIVIAAANKQAKAVGVEIDPYLVAFSRNEIQRQGLSARAQILQQDFYKADLKRATVVTLFLSAKVAATLEDKLRKELKRGVVVISNGSLIGGWKPDLTHFDGQILCNKEGKCRPAPFYFWRVK